MNLSQTEIMIFFPILIVFGLWTGWNDMRHMKITNNTVLLLAGIFAVIGFFILPLDAYLWRWAYAAIALGITFVMNAFRMIGGGDAKFVAAGALFVASGDWVSAAVILVCTMMATPILMLIARISPIRRMTPDWKCWTAGLHLPMGIALGSALILYYIVALKMTV